MMKMNRVLKALVIMIVLSQVSPVLTFAQEGAEQKEKSSGAMTKIFGQDPKDKKDSQKRDAQKGAQTAGSSSAT